MPSSNPDAIEYVDVLIIGAGPAGCVAALAVLLLVLSCGCRLALANWFRASDIRVLLLEKKPSTTPRGQAEGLKSTTVEMFESFGIGPQIWGEAWRLEEQAIWGPQKRGDGTSADTGIVRELTIPDKTPELGKTREVMLQQSRVEHHMLQNLKSSPNIRCWFKAWPTDLHIHESQAENPHGHPISVKMELDCPEKANGKGFETASADGGTPNAKQAKSITTNGVVINRGMEDAFSGSFEKENTETRELRVKYVVGCDGAHSWTREKLGVKLQGDVNDAVFGVVDIIPKSSFPDLRKTCYVRAKTGTLMIIPRSNFEIRLYVPVEEGGALSNPRELAFEDIIRAARKILAPYTLEVLSCSWWSAYRVGQRVGDQFSVLNRGFLAGDAVRMSSQNVPMLRQPDLRRSDTHSPKAGQVVEIHLCCPSIKQEWKGARA